MRNNIFNIFNILLLCIIALGAMTGCNNKPDELDLAGQPVKLKANIKAASVVKVADDRFETSDKVGIYMKKTGIAINELGAALDNAINESMSVSETGELTSSLPVFYPMDGSSVDFVAYSPYSSSPLPGRKIEVNLAQQSEKLPAELLFSDNATNVASSSNTVELQFRYTLAKLAITVKNSDDPQWAQLEAADFNGMKAIVEAMYTTAEMQLVDGTFAAHGGKQEVRLNKTGYTAESASFEGLIFPTVFTINDEGEEVGEEMTLIFSVGLFDTYICKMENAAFEGGVLYELEIDLEGKKAPKPEETQTASLLKTSAFERTPDAGKSLICK